MPFTEKEVVNNCTDFINKLEAPACNCNAGVRMCKHTPCIGTVEDMRKLMDAGYAKNLMLDWWVGEDSGKKAINKILEQKDEPEPPILFERKEKLHNENPFTEDVSYLVPAVVGSEGKQANFVKVGACNLLVNDKCSVHDLNLKPIQGRMACCKIHRVYLDENGKQQKLDERIPILHTWNTQEGKDLIERWKKEVNFSDTSNKASVPSTIPDLLDALMSILDSHTSMYEKPKEGEPELYDDKPIKTVTYEKNY